MEAIGCECPGVPLIPAEARITRFRSARGEVAPRALLRKGEGALSAPRIIQAALLVSQVLDITLPFRIGHAFVTTLCILRQPIVVLVALAIRHSSISALFVPAELSEFE